MIFQKVYRSDSERNAIVVNVSVPSSGLSDMEREVEEKDSLKLELNLGFLRFFSSSPLLPPPILISHTEKEVEVNGAREI